MLAKLWLCRAMSCSGSSHFSSSASMSDESRRSSRPSLAMLVCSCEHGKNRKKPFSVVSTASNQHNPTSRCDARCGKLLSCKMSAYYHMNAINPSGKWHKVSCRLMRCCHNTRCEVMYGCAFIAYTTSASSLTALALFELAECFCDKIDLHWDDDYESLYNWNINEGGCCDTHPWSGQWQIRFFVS